MLEKRSFILNASVAALAVDKAKSDLEVAKNLVEAAKAAVAEASSAYDEALNECETAGLVKSKVKKAVEEINSAFATAGADEVVAETTLTVTTEAEKPARKKRKGKDEESETVVAEAAVVKPVEVNVSATDNTEAVAEIMAIFEEAVSKSVEQAVPALDAIKIAVEAYSAQNSDIDLDGFRSFAAAWYNESDSALIEGIYAVIDSVEAGGEVAALFPKAQDSSIDENAGIEPDVIDAVIEIEAQQEAPTEPDELAEEVAAAVEVDVVETAPETITVVEPSEVIVAEEAIETETVIEHDGYEVSEDDAANYPDYDAEDYASAVSDDETFPITGEPDELEESGVQVVDDIDGMNFLSEEEVTTKVEEPAAPAVSEPVAEVKNETTEEAKPAPRRAFAPPAFLQKKV